MTASPSSRAEASVLRVRGGTCRAEGPAAATDGRSVAIGSRLLAWVALSALPFAGSWARAADDPPPLLLAKIVFETPDDREAFRLDPEGATAELQSAAGEELATYERSGDRVRIVLTRGAPGGTVEATAARNRYILRSADGKAVERELVREPDGDWQFLDAKQAILAELKLRPDGFKLVDGEGKEIGRVKVKEGETSLRDEKGSEVLETGDPISPLAAACFRLPSLTLPQKGALALAIIVWPAPSPAAKPGPGEGEAGGAPPKKP